MWRFLAHATLKDFVAIAAVFAAFAMQWQAIHSRLLNIEKQLDGPPALVSRVDKIEQSLSDIRDSLHEIKDAVTQQ